MSDSILSNTGAEDSNVRPVLGGYVVHCGPDGFCVARRPRRTVFIYPKDGESMDTFRLSKEPPLL